MKAGSPPAVIHIETISARAVALVVGHKHYLIPRPYVASTPVIGDAGGDWITYFAVGIAAITPATQPESH